MFYILSNIFNIINAIYDADRIKQHKRIYHFYNGVLYCVLLLVCWLVNHNWKEIIALMALRKIEFDILLNILRNKHPFYVSDKTGSKIDQLLLAIFKNPYVMYGFILLIFLTAVI